MAVWMIRARPVPALSIFLTPRPDAFQSPPDLGCAQVHVEALTLDFFHLASLTPDGLPAASARLMWRAKNSLTSS